MKIAIYPGSFNPWTPGHDDIVRKTLMIFDKVVVCAMQNPEKGLQAGGSPLSLDERVEMVCEPTMLLVDAVKKYTASAVIRGLRNGTDLEKEMIQHDINEDLGLSVPVVFFMSDRDYRHVSSSATRAVRHFKPDWTFPVRNRRT